MADAKSKAEMYNDAIKKVDTLLKKQKELNKSTESLKTAWGSISSEIFGIGSAEWFKEIPKTTEEIARQQELIFDIKNQLKFIGNELNQSVKTYKESLSLSNKEITKNLDGLSKTFKSQKEIVSEMMQELNFAIPEEEAIKAYNIIKSNVGDLGNMQKKDAKELKELTEKYGISQESIAQQIKESQENSKDYYENLLGLMPELNKIDDERLKKSFLTALAQDDISGFLSEHKEKGLAVLRLNEDLMNSLGIQADQYLRMEKSVEEIEKDLQKTEKTIFSFRQAFLSISKNIVAGIIPKLKEFDQVINDAQKNTSIMFDDNTRKMTDLTRSTVIFGMGIQDAASFMGSMGEELRTTDFSVLSKATDDLKAIQLATGISAENLSSIAGEMMRSGESSERVADAMAEANVMARRFGVSSKKVLEGVSRNIEKMRTMGFVGGEESLIKMVATAERLRMNVDEIFDVAKRSRQIEGAMEMAAELQLAGGSFSNINPMDLLAASRKGPEELQKILTQMGADVGRFAKNAQGQMEYVFDPVDVDRLQIVADATGMTLDSLQKMIQKNAQDNEKLNLMPDISFQGLTDASGNPIDPDQIKNTLLDSVDMTGKALDGSILDKAGIKDLSQITREQAQAIMRDQIEKEKNLEEQAKQNQSFNDSLTALKGAFMNLFTYLQPIVEKLTMVFQAISGFLKSLGPIAPILLGLIATMSILPKLIAVMGKLAFQFNPKNLSSIFKFGGLKDAMKYKAGGGVVPPDKLAGNINRTDDLGRKASGVRGKSGLQTLAQGLKAMGSPKVFAGIGAVALAGPALLLLLPAIPVLMAMAVVGVMGKAVEEGFRATGRGISALGQYRGIYKGVLALALIGAALIPFALAAALFSGIEWETLIKAGVALLGLVGILSLVGLIVGSGTGVPLLMGALALIAISAALAIAAVGLMAFGIAMQELSKVDWASFDGIGSALAKVAGGLALFALAGLLFANPITLIGMMLMIGTLAAISVVLIPLAEALSLGGEGMNSMASGVMKLTDSLQKLDFEKLDKLKEFSTEMSKASSGTAMINAMEKLSKTLGSSGVGGQGGNVKRSENPIIIQLKMPNGRILEEHIVKDIEKST